jgi:MarR family transcriptional regulator, organic hydroperoxide resistance regulator
MIRPEYTAEEARPNAARGGPTSYAIFRVARNHHLLARRLMQTVGLYPGQEMVMMHLWEVGPQRQVDLVNVLDGDPATMTRTIGRLERAGFVRRTRSQTDRRTIIVESTDAGLALRGEVERLWHQLEVQTLSGFSAKERKTLAKLLLDMDEHLTQILNG